ncbi:MAG TPA: hypothetical protein DEP69_06885 [Acidimicrobiaceae bacterium]|nr:hypothetical protein [Acidimicrobiaceae bacterium]
MAIDIFETMNDRGLTLTPAEMLKSYIISQLDKESDAVEVATMWSSVLAPLLTGQAGRKNGDLLFIRAWLRSKHAGYGKDIEDAVAVDDFRQIGNRFNKWVRSNKDQASLELSDPADFKHLVTSEMKIFADHYRHLREASKVASLGEPGFKGLEPVYYNSYNSYDRQYECMLAAVSKRDDPKIANKKFRLLSAALDIYVVRLMVSGFSFEAGIVKTAMYDLILKIRDCSLEELGEKLRELLDDQSANLAGIRTYELTKKNHARYLLARITAWLDHEMLYQSSVRGYLNTKLPRGYDIEHIIPDSYNHHSSEFKDEADFARHRNLLASLLLLPKSINTSLGKSPYNKKLEKYGGENWLARSLTRGAYKNDTRVDKTIREFNLPLEPHDVFGKPAIEQRQDLLRSIAEEVWNPKHLLAE